MKLPWRKKPDPRPAARPACDHCFRVLDPAASRGPVAAAKFKRCPHCGARYHTTCAGDHCPAPGCASRALEPLPPRALPALGPLDTRRRRALPPDLPPLPEPPASSTASSSTRRAPTPAPAPASTPSPANPRRPRRLRRFLFRLAVLTVLIHAIIIPDFGSWPTEPRWLDTLNQHRLEARESLLGAWRRGLTRVRDACDHLLGRLDPPPGPESSLGSRTRHSGFMTTRGALRGTGDGRTGTTADAALRILASRRAPGSRHLPPQPLRAGRRPGNESTVTTVSANRSTAGSALRGDPGAANRADFGLRVALRGTASRG